MGELYRHLTWRERLRIETRLKDGWKPQRIADEIGRHVSTIYREIKRGLGVQRTTDLIDYECYIPEIAREKYEATFSGKGPDLKIGKDHKLANYLGEVLKDGYRSPEAALGEIAVKGMEFDTKISPRTLYRYIEMGIIPGISSADLPIKRNQGKKKEKQKPRAARNCRGKSIEERPREINAREEVGHWEMDTVESAKDGSLERVLALTGRVTRSQINIKIKRARRKWSLPPWTAWSGNSGLCSRSCSVQSLLTTAPSLRTWRVWSGLASAREKRGRRPIIATRTAPANGAPMRNKTA